MDYNWREDILDIVDQDLNPSWAPVWDEDEKDALFYRAGQASAEENGTDYYGGEITEDDIWEEASSIIGLYAIPIDSTTYELLDAWYARRDQVLSDEVRSYFDDGRYMYFVTGAQYDIFDQDLLGGNGNGETKAAFEEFVLNY